MIGIAGFVGTSNTQKFKFDLSIGVMSNTSYGLIVQPQTGAVDTITVSYFYL
jgi:hypothetical protein